MEYAQEVEITSLILDLRVEDHPSGAGYRVSDRSGRVLLGEDDHHGVTIEEVHRKRKQLLCDPARAAEIWHDGTRKCGGGEINYLFIKVFTRLLACIAGLRRPRPEGTDQRRSSRALALG